MYDGPRPGTWQRVRTNAGWHLRLVAANGEAVVDGEVLEDAASVTVALTAVYYSCGVTPHTFAAAQAAASLVNVDERE